MNQTTNYQLNQWDPDDRVLRTDFNADNAKIDAALAALSARAGNLEKALVTCGNCRIYTTSYVGTGDYGSDHPNSLMFPGTPLIVLIGDRNNEGRFFHALAGMSKTFAYSSSYAMITMSWGTNTLSWSHHMSASGQMNASGITYSVVALLEMAD